MFLELSGFDIILGFGAYEFEIFGLMTEIWDEFV